MAKLSACFASHGLIGLSSKHSNLTTDFTNHHCRRLVLVSCQMRQRNLRDEDSVASFSPDVIGSSCIKWHSSSQHKRQTVKKIFPEPKIDAKLQPNGEADVEAEIAPISAVSSLQLDVVPNNDAGNSMITKQVEGNMTKVDDSIIFPHSPSKPLYNISTITVLGSFRLLSVVNIYSKAMSCASLPSIPGKCGRPDIITSHMILGFFANWVDGIGFSRVRVGVGWWRRRGGGRSEVSTGVGGGRWSSPLLGGGVTSQLGYPQGSNHQIPELTNHLQLVIEEVFLFHSSWPQEFLKSLTVHAEPQVPFGST
ncbi:hypothetical protein Cgig2_025065 [Carnegiea gigantea]|uniref:Uncharacterized protein n=1 Tax=Carnegiea gigantea TaxID=171969 RepID=A0A9Q1JQT5_9CARY|nr:hypothetical protein Cgig2_025065 [Carnegiea gigantea]